VTTSLTATNPRVAVASSVLVALIGCATVMPPPPQVVRAAAAARSYSGSLRVSLKGDDVRGRSRVLLAFRRPASVRIEIPGPTGARLLAVASDDRLTAVFPAQRAVFETTATAAGLDALIGVALAPDELIDMLVGVAPVRLHRYEARWGASVPERIDAVLPDGTRLRASVDDAEIDLALPAGAFDPPPHAEYRPIDAAEARSLLGRR
jgi:hypothetical protein